MYYIYIYVLYIYNPINIYFPEDKFFGFNYFKMYNIFTMIKINKPFKHIVFTLKKH